MLVGRILRPDEREHLDLVELALFIVDITKEHIAVAEARKLNIPVAALIPLTFSYAYLPLACASNSASPMVPG